MKSTHTPTAVMRPPSAVGWERLLPGQVTVVSADERPDVDIRQLDLGGVSAAFLKTGPHNLVNTAQTARSGGAIVDFWYLRAGSMLAVQDGRCEIAQPGDLLSTDRGRPLKLRFLRSSQLLHVPVPARRLGITGHPSPLAGCRLWARDGGAVTLLLSVLAGFAESVEELDTTTTAQFGYQLTDLIALAAGQVALAGRSGPGRVRTDMLRRIQGYARQHLDDPSLDLASLARRHNVSVRYIQKLFQEHGLSPIRWIRRERLARCMADLKDSQKTGVSVAMIGRRWGFLTPSYFTRAFRQEYGLTPSQARAVAGLEGA
ncbi:helix-turn-helix domain-containing protein [Glycomyces arizonensis]|uniref:helix-turn-helix domain-containing protein n=1 Tax=Glycomyces arizonensis TaxID=256035 RepID=UPI0003F940A4|nr:helix-turn-helix domain-containing protein [Glycomyces arizonensis]